MKEYYCEYENVLVELDTCPFCGFEPKINRIGLSGYTICCTNRSCKAEQCVYSTLAEAARKWNGRVK